MKIKHFTLILISFLLFYCTPEYKSTTAKITELDTLDNFREEGNYQATYEYTVQGVTYSDHFEINMMTMVNDSIAMPHPGTEFEILYTPSNPEQNKADFRVKAKYSKPDNEQ